MKRWTLLIGMLILIGLAGASYVSAAYEDALNLTAMTDNNAPTPYVASCDNCLAPNPAYFSFDNQTSNNDGSQLGGSFPHYVQMDFGAGNTQVITGYNITATRYAGSRNFDWRDFNFACSNSANASYVTLDTQTGVTWSASQTRTYTFANANAYRYCRWTVTAAQGSATDALIAELRAFRTTNVASPSANSLAISINDSRTNTSITGFTYNLTNGTASWTGFCAGTSCSQNTTNITSGTLYFTNISGGGYENASMNGITFNTTNAQNITGMTWRSCINLTPVKNVVDGTYETSTIQVTNGGTQFAYNDGSSNTTVCHAYGNVNVLWYNITGGTFYNTTANVTGYNDTTLSLTNTTYQALLDINVTQLLTNNQIKAGKYNVTNWQSFNTLPNGSVGYYVLANNGTNNIKVDVAGNLSRNYTCTVPQPLQLVSCNATGIYDSLLTVGAHSFLGQVITNFSIQLSNGTLGGTVGTKSTGNGSVAVPVLQNYLYQLAFTAPLWSDQNQSLFVNTSAPLYNFTAFSSNSVTLLVYDEQTGQLVKGNSSMKMIGSYQQYNFTIVDGSGFYSLLAPDSYNVLVSSPGYYLRNSIITIIPQTTQTVTAYLLNSSDSGNQPVVFYVTDATGLALSNVSIVSQLLSNTTWTTTEGRLTDVSGQAKMYFDTTTYYRVTFSKPGYVTQVNQLQPASGTYNVRMVAGNSIAFTTISDSVAYTTLPTNSVLSPGQYNLSIITTSSTGAVNYFGLSYNGASQNVTSCPMGCTAYLPIDLSGANPGNTITVSYWVKTYNNSLFNWTGQYLISDAPQNQNGTIGATTTKYAAQMGLGGRIIFGVIIIVVSLLALAAFLPIAALGIVALLLLIVVTIIGLFPAWLGIIMSVMLGLGIFVTER